MKIRRTIPAMLVLVAALLTTGCADFKTYIKDRGNDLADCFTARAGIAYGLGVRTQVTNYVRVSAGIGSYSGKWVGYFGRNRVDESPLEQAWIGLPFSVLYLFSTEFRVGRSKDDWTASLLGVHVEEFRRPNPQWSPGVPLVREKFFIEVGATLGAVGFDLGFNPVEFVDFLLGWTTLDITGDDAGTGAAPESPPPD